jgi:hypothetical protein
MLKHILSSAALILLVTLAQAQTAENLQKSATAFLNTLSADQRKQTVYAFEDSARSKWTNLPVGLVPRAGVQYGSLSDESRITFHQVLSSALSSQGYLKLTSIMQLDDILNSLFQASFEKGEINKEMLTRMQDLKWAHDNYYIAIFGNPEDKAWAMSFGGHHIALNITSVDKKISYSPLFIGTDPALIQKGKYAGWRVLSKEEDYGFMLINFLNDRQKAKAVLSQEVPKDIITNPNSSQRITEYYGISAKEFTADQQEILKLLIREYTHDFDHETAHALYERVLKTGIDKIYFAWIGSQEKLKPHYYIINAPDLLIEYDNFQNKGNHIHAIVRAKENDFGADLLKQHYLTSDHHKK